MSHRSGSESRLSLTCVEENYGFHAEKLLAGYLKVRKLLGDELDRQAEVVNRRSPHLLPDRHKKNKQKIKRLMSLNVTFFFLLCEV